MYKKINQPVHPIKSVRRHHIQTVSISLKICVQNCTGCWRKSFIIPTSGQYLLGLFHIMQVDKGFWLAQRTTFQQETRIGEKAYRKFIRVLQSGFEILRPSTIMRAYSVNSFDEEFMGAKECRVMKPVWIEKQVPEIDYWQIKRGHRNWNKQHKRYMYVLDYWVCTNKQCATRMRGEACYIRSLGYGPAQLPMTLQYERSTMICV